MGRQTPDRRFRVRFSLAAATFCAATNERSGRCRSERALPVCRGVVKRLLVLTIDGLGSPSVTWVLDERGVVGDDIFDWVTPERRERGRLIVLGPLGRDAADGQRVSWSFRPRNPDVLLRRSGLVDVGGAVAATAWRRSLRGRGS